GPFGSGGHIEALGHCDDRANDREAFRAPLRSALDEAAVDLDGREFERPNVAKRGVPGAEVVERDRAAERHYFLESLPRRAGVAQEDALGHLDFEPVRWQLAVREGADDMAGEAGLEQLLPRDVDRDLELALPLRCLPACLVQHPVADRHDQAGLLGKRNELAGADESVLLALPA